MNDKLWHIYDEVSSGLEQDDRFPIEEFTTRVIQECVEIIEGSPWNLPRGYTSKMQADLIRKTFGLIKES
jgi:hypothetical protein